MQVASSGQHSVDFWREISFLLPIVSHSDNTSRQPDKQFPKLFGNNKLFLKFPFLLPNLVAAIFFLGGIIVGFLYLKVHHLHPYSYHHFPPFHSH